MKIFGKLTEVVQLVFRQAGGKEVKLESAIQNGLSTDVTFKLPDAAAASTYSGTLVEASLAQTLTNKTLVDSSTTIVDSTDSTKAIKFDAAGTTGTSTTLTSSQTANRIITLPDVAGTVVTTGDTGTVTSAMIANGTIVDADINAAAIYNNSTSQWVPSSISNDAYLGFLLYFM